MTRKRGEADLVHLYPDPHHYIQGEPAVERDVSPEEAERLLAYHPPAYHLEPPVQVAPSPPDEGADQPTPGEPGPDQED